MDGAPALSGCIGNKAHGPFVASVDDDFEPSKLTKEIPAEHSQQYGYCADCYAPMRWDPKIHELVMWL